MNINFFLFLLTNMVCFKVLGRSNTFEFWISMEQLFGLKIHVPFQV